MEPSRLSRDEQRRFTDIERMLRPDFPDADGALDTDHDPAGRLVVASVFAMLTAVGLLANSSLVTVMAMLAATITLTVRTPRSYLLPWTGAGRGNTRTNHPTTL